MLAQFRESIDGMYSKGFTHKHTHTHKAWPVMAHLSAFVCH